MKEKRLLLSFISIILGVFLINFVSASFHYGGFGLSNILDSIDPSTMFLGLLFIVIFVFSNYALSKFFKDNKSIGGILSFVISLGIVYWVNRTGLDFEGFFFNIGFSSGILYTIIPLVLIGGIIFLGFKYDFGTILATVGGFLLIVSFTDLVYERGFIFIIGLILLGISGWMLLKKKPKVDAWGRSMNS
jgi:hypothetical protein|tara:strand:- start:3380 stop:3946 length:567 start_codon:yes stop_codon:yes gene_type:complete